MLQQSGKPIFLLQVSRVLLLVELNVSLPSRKFIMSVRASEKQSASKQQNKSKDRPADLANNGSCLPAPCPSAAAWLQLLQA